MSRKFLGVTSLFAAAFALLGLGERTSEFSDQLAITAQAPIHRHDDQDKTHH